MENQQTLSIFESIFPLPILFIFEEEERKTIVEELLDVIEIDRIAKPYSRYSHFPFFLFQTGELDKFFLE